MRGGKDEDKVISPMFPRLHVNDTEKGGPRAPPRNKMEQLSVPSQRGSASMLPLSASNGVTLVPLTSSSTHGGGLERSPFIPFCNSHTVHQSPENHHSYSSTGANFSASLEFTKPTEYPSSNTTSIAKLHSFQPPKFYSIKKHGGEDVVVVPTFAPIGIVASPCSNTQQSKDQEQPFPLFHMSSSWQLQAADPKSRQHGTNQTGANPKVCTRQDSLERSVSIVSMRDKILVDSSPCLSTKDKTSGVKRPHASLEQKHISLLDAINKRHGTDARLFQECLNLRDKPTLLKDSMKGMVRENAPNVVSDTWSRPSVGGTNGPKRLANGREYCEDEEYGSVKVGEPKKDNDISDSSMVDSDSVLDISPDDVVGVLGDKHFWKARRAIVTQQRVFAVQVFELHRLVKVQRLIAGSPNFLLEDHLKGGSLAKKLSSESAPKPINGSETPNPETKFGSESAFSTLALPQKPSYGPFSGSQLPPPPPVTSNINANKPSPWFFHPPLANQWLVPVMSPSEGFVYKPFTSADPPNVAGLMAPFFGNYESPRNGDLLNTTDYGSHAYFTPLMNPYVSGSALEHENQLSQMSRAIGKQQATKESELQGSTASSPSLRVNGEALPLFPMASDLNASEPPQPKGRVIKVVPHNPRSATESAARIFQFIQEERKQFD